MNLFCIVFCTILIATANAKPSKANNSVADDSPNYYDEIPEEQLGHNLDHESEPLDQNDERLTPRFLMKPEVVIAKQGESAVLKCPTQNTEDYGLVWLKDKTSIAQGTLVFKKELYEINKNNSLTIKNVQPGSVGYYSCVIAISATDNVSLTHRLKLENGAEVLSLHTPDNKTQLRTGDTLVLVCEVDGKPLPAVKWFIDNNDSMGAREIERKDHRHSAESKATLTIENVTFSNNGTYRCSARNELTEDHRTIVIEVFDSRLYIEIEKIYQNNDLVGLSCLLLLNVTEVELSWKKYDHDNKAVNVDTSLERTSRSLTLLFSDSNFLNSGVYLCTAKNVGLKGLVQKRIHIQPPSKPMNLAYNFTSYLKWTIQSDLLITECKVLNREAKTCGRFGNSDRRLNIRVQEYYSYIITYTLPGHLKGQYEFILICKNEDGWSESSDIQTIDFGVAPIMRIEKIYSKSKLLIGFNCVVMANPFPHIFWKRNDAIISSNHTVQKTKNSLKLIFSDPTESDFGQYTCIAKNYENSTEKVVMFSKPLQPQFRGFQTLGNTKGQKLTWSVQSHEPIKLCVVYYTGENDTRQSIAATEIQTFQDGFVVTYTPVVPNGGTYRFRIKCLSDAGWSDESQERTLDITDKGRDPATSDSQVSRGLRLLPSVLLFTATAILLNQ